MDQRVKLGNPRHTYAIGISSGLNMALDYLAAVPKNLQATPGFMLAMATIQAQAAEHRAYNISRNLAFLAKNGVDVATHRAVSYDAETDEFICELYSPDEVNT